MSTLKGKKILLGVCGSIAAYKVAFLTRLLMKKEAIVKIIMTKAATQFITPLSLSTLSKNPVLSDIFSDDEWNNHVELGLWADVFLVVPATATTISKMTNGLCDNLLLATYLSSRCPVWIAPAMDLDMWKHPATQENISKLSLYGNRIIDVDHGELASGLIGAGRMAEPEHIIKLLDSYFQKPNLLSNRNVLVTAGPTYEALDPVRFLGNRSSGKMGVAIAEVLGELGANVTLILGPSQLQPQHTNIHTIRIETAQEMYEQCLLHFKSMDAAILSAAVADFRPARIASEKIKKKGDSMCLELERTIDIAVELGKMKNKKQLLIGFALETQNEEINAIKKLHKKNFDFIVLNSLKDKGAGFQHDTNKISILDNDGNKLTFSLKSKKEVAVDIVNKLASYWNNIA